MSATDLENAYIAKSPTSSEKAYMFTDNNNRIHKCTLSGMTIILTSKTLNRLFKDCLLINCEMVYLGEFRADQIHDAFALDGCQMYGCKKIRYEKTFEQFQKEQARLTLVDFHQAA